MVGVMLLYMKNGYLEALPLAGFLREAAGDYWSSPGKVSNRLRSQGNLWVQISNSCFLALPCELAIESLKWYCVWQM